MKSFKISLMLVLAGLLVPSVLHAEESWEENFDAIKEGKLIIGKQGWDGFCERVRDAAVTNERSHSEPNSLLIGDFTNTDIANDLVDARKGLWQVSIWLYIPSGDRNETVVTLYNDYNGKDCEFTETTSVLFTFDGKVQDQIRRYTERDIIFDEWVQLRIEVNLDDDKNTLKSFYNDKKLSENDIYTILGGETNIAALSLFSSSPVYVDDISIAPPPTCFYKDKKVKKKKCRESGCPEKSDACDTTSNKSCGSVGDCKKKFVVKEKCIDPKEKGKCKFIMERCDC